MIPEIVLARTRIVRAAWPHVKALSGVDGTEVASFLTYGAGFTAGVFVAGAGSVGVSASIISPPDVPAVGQIWSVQPGVD